ncbi:hypothetical protein [Parabacteroides goldsteinii]|uniref:hypothetical protein n=1 Tax=Parabacteroides goldsteinii TaxID=328812 RepID=UPI0025AE768C|nr:hypothetical protein [Parabacteroides goldsteinii]
MKRNKIYLFFLSGLLLAACSKEDEPASTPSGEDAFATVSVAVDGINGTKADGATTDPATLGLRHGPDSYGRQQSGMKSTT